MRAVTLNRRFRRDMKRIKSGGVDIIKELKDAVVLLQADIPLEERFHDHALKGGWAPARECHIRPDILLVYEKRPGELELLRLASHSELFGK